MNTLIEEVQADGGCHACKETQEILNFILAELQALRRDRLPADPQHIEGLLAVLHSTFSESEFTAFDVFLECDNNDTLRAAVCRCLKNKLTIRALSLVLSKSVGRHGAYVLERCDKTRVERYYKIVTK